MTAAEQRVGDDNGDEVAWPEMSMSQMLDGEVRVPERRTCWDASRIVTVEEVCIAVKPWSQRVPMERREPIKSGKT